VTARILLAFALSCGLAAFLSRGLARWGWLDRPNARSSHRHPTPRGGGLAFLVSSCLLAPQPLLLIPLPLALVGLLDDRYGLTVGLRLGVQWLTGLGLAMACGCPAPLAPVAALAVTAVINAINFMDGLDGLVTSCLAMWLLLAAILVSQGSILILVAALLGFLIWNWSPARLFMGDVGSTYLGAVMAGVLLFAWRSDEGTVAPLLLAAFPLLGDAGSCLVRRWRAGQALWQAHRLHLYQRLYQAGWSHRQVAGLYAGTTIALGLLALVCSTWPSPLQLPVMGGTAVLTLAAAGLLDRHCAVPFASALRTPASPPC